MGIGAYVHCRCWRDGLATPPPAGPIGFDEYGRLGLLLPWEGNEDEHGAVEHWMRTGCRHEDMRIASEYLGSGTRHLGKALRETGATHFPTLLRYLPRFNEGCIPAAEVPGAGQELDYFENHARLADEIVLFDEATGDALQRGVFVRGRYDIGVDADGFFVLDNGGDPPATLFRAMRFEQRVLPDGLLEFTGGERTVRLAMRPIDEFRPVTPQRMAVEVRSRSGADFAYLLGMLRRLCAASLATESPVTWT